MMRKPLFYCGDVFVQSALLGGPQGDAMHVNNGLTWPLVMGTFFFLFFFSYFCCSPQCCCTRNPYWLFSGRRYPVFAQVLAFDFYRDWPLGSFSNLIHTSFGVRVFLL